MIPVCDHCGSYIEVNNFRFVGHCAAACRDAARAARGAQRAKDRARDRQT